MNEIVMYSSDFVSVVKGVKTLGEFSLETSHIKRK
jgi:hypothetical protein